MMSDAVTLRAPESQNGFPQRSADAAPPPPQRYSLDRSLAVVRRYKWLILGVVLLASVAGFLVTRLMTPHYEVRATVWVESSIASNTNRSGPIRPNDLLTATGWIELFRSYRVVDEVVRTLGLYVRPEQPNDARLFANFSVADRFAPGKYELRIDRSARRWVLRRAEGLPVQRGSLADSVGAQIGFRWTLPEAAFDGVGDRVVPFSVTTPREISVNMLDQLTTKLMPGSSFLWLGYRDTAPHRGARTLNAWVAEFVRVAAELKKVNMVETARVLEGQLQYAERSTQEAEEAYQRFRVGTITLPTDASPVAAGVNETQNAALSSFFDQKIQYDNLRHDREALEKAMAGADAGTGTDDRLLFIPTVSQSPVAQALREAYRKQRDLEDQLRVQRETYTDEHPSVKELLASVETLRQRTIPQLANGLLDQIRERENDFSRRIAGASRELQQIPPRTIEEMRLQRAVVVATGLYANLKNRYEEIRLAEAAARPDVNVLDTAIAPLSPTSNRAPHVMLLSVLAGLGAAVGLALLLDALDRRIRYSEQVTNELGLEIAGAMPLMPKRGIRKNSPEQVLQLVESVRSIRMHVINSSAGNRITLAVTSAAPNDGKSFTSSNLALSFAEAGMKTVLVDADTRRGALHQVFDLDLNDGLTEYLAGVIDGGQVQRPTTHDNLWFVSCGRRDIRSPELLGSPRFKDLADHLAGAYDVVIFDTPPLAAGMDAYAVSAVARRMLMVVRMGQTEKRLASAKLSIVDRLPIQVLGAVLNGVSLRGEFQYYAYSPGYGIDGYSDREDPVTTPGRLVAPVAYGTN
jgi:succinoglycan biosynthesis transport protein ExoP